MRRKLPSDSEFKDNWDSPPWLLGVVRDAHRYQPLSARRYILDRLKSGEYVAAGRLKTVLGIIPSDHWETWDDYGDAHFWTTGDATFYVSTSITGYDQATVRYLGVRIDPVWRDQESSASPEKPKGAVSAGDIQAWYAALSPDDQALGLRPLWAKAKADHPGMTVMRKQIEPFTAGRKRGPRGKN